MMVDLPLWGGAQRRVELPQSAVECDVVTYMLPDKSTQSFIYLGNTWHPVGDTNVWSIANTKFEAWMRERKNARASN